MVRVKACGLSDVGLTRVHNEDYFEIDPEHRLYVVADGMGGHSHGEVAAQLAVNSIRDFIHKTADQDTTWPFGMDNRLERHTNLLKMSIRIAHDSVLRAISKDGTLYGMGTTVVGVLLSGTVAAVREAALPTLILHGEADDRADQVRLRLQGPGVAQREQAHQHDAAQQAREDVGRVGADGVAGLRRREPTRPALGPSLGRISCT